MLYIIGLYHYPPNPAESESRPQFVWQLLAGPFRKMESAVFSLELERTTHVRDIGGLEWRAVYRMVVREAQLEWYGLTPNKDVPANLELFDTSEP